MWQEKHDIDDLFDKLLNKWSLWQETIMKMVHVSSSITPMFSHYPWFVDEKKLASLITPIDTFNII